MATSLLFLVGVKFLKLLLRQKFRKLHRSLFSVTHPENSKYCTARLRYLPFDRCFSFWDEDVDDCKFHLSLNSTTLVVLSFPTVF